MTIEKKRVIIIDLDPDRVGMYPRIQMNIEITEPQRKKPGPKPRPKPGFKRNSVADTGTSADVPVTLT
jgi:hypothetical protein